MRNGCSDSPLAVGAGARTLRRAWLLGRVVIWTDMAREHDNEIVWGRTSLTS
jgi:hypothetical protein